MRGPRALPLPRGDRGRTFDHPESVSPGSASRLAARNVRVEPDGLDASREKHARRLRKRAFGWSAIGRGSHEEEVWDHTKIDKAAVPLLSKIARSTDLVRATSERQSPLSFCSDAAENLGVSKSREAADAPLSLTVWCTTRKHFLLYYKSGFGEASFPPPPRISTLRERVYDCSGLI